MRERVTRASEVHGVSVPLARTPARVGEPAGPGRTAGEGEDWLYRYRRELRAPAVILGLAGCSTLGHLLVPGLVWLPLVLGCAVVMALLSLPLPLPKGERRYVVTWVGPAIIWTTASWAAGIDQPAVLLSLLGLGGWAAVTWVRLQHPRSRIEVDAGRETTWLETWRHHRRAHRELGHVADIWPWITERAGVPGATLSRLFSHHENGYALHVDLKRGDTGKDIRLDRLASALREFPVVVRTPDPERPWEVVFEEVLPPAADEWHGEQPDGREEAGWTPPPPIDQAELRLAQLRLVVDQMAEEELSAAELGKRAGGIRRQWMAEHMEDLAPKLGLERGAKGWRRAAAGGER